MITLGLDIGSNSVRLIVYENSSRAPAPVFNEKVLCGVGRAPTSTGKLSQDAIKRALRALRRFRALIDQLGVAHVEVIATAAAREAENGPDFIAQAERILDRKVTVLSGTKEAELAELVNVKMRENAKAIMRRIAQKRPCHKGKWLRRKDSKTPASYIR